VTRTGEVQEAIPRIGSAHVNATETFELFQPAAFGAGDTTGVMVGGTARLRS